MKLKVDYVLVYSPATFQHVANSVNANRSRLMFESWQKEGGILRRFDSLAEHLTDDYYRGCYEKLNVFRMTEYDRVIVMDSDGMAVSNMDHLFLLKMPAGLQVGLVQAYEEHRSSRTVKTVLLRVLGDFYLNSGGKTKLKPKCSEFESK